MYFSSILAVAVGGVKNRVLTETAKFPIVRRILDVKPIVAKTITFDGTVYSHLTVNS